MCAGSGSGLKPLVEDRVLVKSIRAQSNYFHRHFKVSQTEKLALKLTNDNDLKPDITINVVQPYVKEHILFCASGDLGTLALESEKGVS